MMSGSEPDSLKGPVTLDDAHRALAERIAL